MKKIIILALALSILPTAVFAAKPDQCVLNSTCSFTIRGKFNKEMITPDLQAGQKYSCTVLRGPGKLLTVKNVYVSKGVRYELKGTRLNKPFIIYGPKRGTGTIRYTIYNNNDPWHNNNIQFECKAVR